MTSSSPFGRGTGPQTVPRGDVLGTYDTYQEALRVVDRLAKADFTVGEVSIIGNDLKLVERVTRRLSWGRAALEGALSGVWLGLFFALLISLFSPTINIPYFVSALLIGAAFGLFFRLIGYAVSRRSRDFASQSQVLASNYQVLVPAGRLEGAQAALARPHE